ncbi:MAG: FAD-binding protein [Gammaproteobacteria bacterium]|nr:FAD-binding protein [Gammaproteobacteria bacterium]
MEPHGFHFPVEAPWSATIGGMMATNASGAGAVDSGAMLKNVVNCTVITCQEEKIVKIYTGSKAPKSSAGYNLTGLFVGSEGTLGVITKLA